MTDTWAGDIEYEQRDLKVYVSGDLALVHALHRMKGQRTEGLPTDLWFRETLGLVKQGASWKIVHEHSSVPMKMDGFHVVHRSTTGGARHTLGVLLRCGRSTPF